MKKPPSTTRGQPNATTRCRREQVRHLFLFARTEIRVGHTSVVHILQLVQGRRGLAQKAVAIDNFLALSAFEENGEHKEVRADKPLANGVG